MPQTGLLRFFKKLTDTSSTEEIRPTSEGNGCIAAAVPVETSSSSKLTGTSEEIRPTSKGNDCIVTAVSVASSSKLAGISEEIRPTSQGIATNKEAVQVGTSSKGEQHKIKKRKFLTKWQNEFDWLHFDKDTGIAKCSVCVQFKDICDLTSRVVMGIKEPFRHETFKFHNSSETHIKCVNALKTKEHPEQAPLAKCIQKMDKKMLDHLEVLFNASYYIAINNKPFTDLVSLADFARKLKVKVLDEYTSNKQCKEFVKHIASVIKEDVLENVKKSNFASLLLDGSTDKAVMDEMILYARYLKDDKVSESFLGIIELENSTALGYLEAVDQQLKELGLEWRNGNWLVGLGTDGAAAMIGVSSGLATRMVNVVGHLITVHCVAHKLQLSVLTSVKGVSFLKDVDGILIEIFKFYQRSNKHSKQLSITAVALSQKILKIQKVHTIRWVASKVGTIKAVLVDWPCLVAHLESLATTLNNDESSKAKGLLKHLTNFRFMITLHFLMDFLSVFKNISLLFQKENLLLSQVKIHINNAIVKLKNLQQTSGKMEEEFIENTSLRGTFKGVQLTGVDQGQSKFKIDRAKIIEAGIKSLHDRFSNITENGIINDIAIFDTFTWPTGHNLENFGITEISNLVIHFKHLLNDSQHSKDNLIELILNEWYEFKVCGQNLALNDLLHKAMARKDRFPLLSKLLSIVSVLPVSTASCERGFSRMNLIKNKFRTSMTTSSLSDLMMISLNGPPLDKFEPEKAINKWYFSSKTTRHVKGHKRQHSDSATAEAAESSKRFCYE